MSEVVKVLFQFPLIAIQINILIASQYFDAMRYFAAFAA